MPSILLLNDGSNHLFLRKMDEVYLVNDNGLDKQLNTQLVPPRAACLKLGITNKSSLGYKYRTYTYRIWMRAGSTFEYQ
jgi:hypothetical protein